MRNPERFTLLLVLGALASTAVAQRGGGGRGGRNAMPQPKGSYVVVQVENRLSIVRKSQVAWYKQRLNQQNLQEMRQWKEAQKAARENKTKLAAPKPTKKKLKVVNANSKTEEAARKILEALIAKSSKMKSTKARLEEGEPLGNDRGRGRRGGDAGKGGKAGEGEGGEGERRGRRRRGSDKRGGEKKDR